MFFTRAKSRSLLAAMLLASTGCTDPDMEKGHPLAWTLLLFCVLLGVMVVVVPVKRDKYDRNKELEDD